MWVAEVAEVADEMPSFSAENQKWILDQIHAAIHPSGWGRIAYFLRTWGVLGVLVTAFIGIVAIAVAMGVTAFNRVEQNAAFRQHTDDRLIGIEKQLTSLGAIEKQLTSIAADVDRLKLNGQKTIGQILKDRAAGQLGELRFNLQVAEKLVERAQAEPVKADPTSVGEAGKSFVQVASESKDKANSDLAWKVVSQIVNYRSFLFFDRQQYNRILSFPPCPTWNAEKATAQKVGPDGKPTGPVVKIQDFAMNNCSIDLDEAKDVVNITCKNCVIKYSGGPLRLKDVRFENCVFLFSIKTEPSPGGKRLAQDLLAANLRDVTISQELAR
jgi:hypothetical protein